MHNYGDCHVCGGKVEERLVSKDIWQDEELVIVKDVPAGVCKKCGERIFISTVAKKLEKIVITRKKLRLEEVTFVAVPTINFNTEEVLIN